MILLKQHKQLLENYIINYPKTWKEEIKKDWNKPFAILSLRALKQNGSDWLDKLTIEKIVNSEIV